AAAGEPHAGAFLALGRFEEIPGVFAAGLAADDDDLPAAVQARLVRSEDDDDLREFLPEGAEIDHLDALRKTAHGRIVVASEDAGDRLAAKRFPVGGQRNILRAGERGEQAEDSGGEARDAGWDSGRNGHQDWWLGIGGSSRAEIRGLAVTGRGGV